GTSPSKVTIPVPAQWTGKNIKDVWNDQSTILNGSNIEMELPARSARIFVSDERSSTQTIWHRTEQIGRISQHPSRE
ncbi:hypothetical protein L0244_29770, partial [bacterium]|nr:hypothetical protein [bacterium]